MRFKGFLIERNLHAGTDYRKTFMEHFIIQKEREILETCSS